MKKISRIFNAPPLKLERIVCKTGKVASLDALLERNPELNVDKIKYNHWSPVHLCCRHGFAECLLYLLSIQKANPYQTLPGYVTPLHTACLGGHLDCVLVLLEKHALPNIHLRTADGNTPLLIASSRGHVMIVKALLRKGANIMDVEDSKENNALMLACMHGHLDTAKLLIAEGIDLKYTNVQVNIYYILYIIYCLYIVYI